MISSIGKNNLWIKPEDMKFSKSQNYCDDMKSIMQYLQQNKENTNVGNSSEAKRQVDTPDHILEFNRVNEECLSILPPEDAMDEERQMNLRNEKRIEGSHYIDPNFSQKLL
ncbi:hypothetical protein RclHR1_00680038 [Rhizophagus clarus]|uniref:Uncharacterized protein n=1 Tax=Rhizophagus clarus TaxID=94130 RepID=A0A2Z6RUE7_9GLOM|nr:hypothetical protein RclHR1_00680038 [Rhizophagus clarus]GET04816.1 hypothetical protein RCL_jg4758.t1 [Rhizophagus clarus]